MKKVVILLLAFTWMSSYGQNKADYIQEKREQINIASQRVNQTYIPRPEMLKSGNAKRANFEVEFVNFPENAKTAFNEAISIWGSLISSEVTIHVSARWEDLAGNILAFCKPASYYKNFEGAQVADAYYPVALVEKLSGENTNDSDPDIICTINKNTSWYFGTDGKTTSGKYDFVTAVLHEIAHGLGFTGFLEVENNEGFFDNSSNTPSIYDYFILNHLNQQIADKSLFNSPSSALSEQLTSEKLKIENPVMNLKDATAPVWIYAPGSWVEGSSIYHLNSSSLMAPSLMKGNAIHNPGENVLSILNEIGWNSVLFNHNKVKDFETACNSVPMSFSLISDYSIDITSAKLVYSSNYFTTCDTTSLVTTNGNLFSGQLATSNKIGIFQYYFILNTSDGRRFSYPSLAPGKKLSFRIGTDYTAPVIKHIPVQLISEDLQQLPISAKVDDNLGVKSVKVEYKINGILQNALVLNNDSASVFSALASFAGTDNLNSFEYRIIAEDASNSKNKSYSPQSGFYSVDIFRAENPVSEYSSDFNSTTNDFYCNGFQVSKETGFSNASLHSVHPYTTSTDDDEKINLVSQLKYPVIVKNNGILSFDEVVLVEPGLEDLNYKNELFWDYVIVEASLDNGLTWLPLIDGYDSQINQEWNSTFNSSIVNNSSTSNGTEKMYVNHEINLTDNTGLAEGDVIFVRFRLASDESVNGWGWAIDNLEIQTKEEVTNTEIAPDYEVKVYPNPCPDFLKFDFSNSLTPSQIEVAVYDLSGKTVYKELWADIAWNTHKEIDLTKLHSGIYMVQAIDENANKFTQKIVKN